MDIISNQNSIHSSSITLLEKLKNLENIASQRVILEEILDHQTAHDLLTGAEAHLGRHKRRR